MNTLPSRHKDRTLYRCPADECESLVQRLDKHLRQKHGLRTGQDKYVEYMLLAKRDSYKVSVSVPEYSDCGEDTGNEKDDDHELERRKKRRYLEKSSKKTEDRNKGDEDEDVNGEDEEGNDKDDEEYYYNNDNEDDDDEYNSDEDIENDKNDNVSEEMLDEVTSFCEWLQGIGGSWKSEITSKQTSNQVLIVLRKFGTDFSLEKVTGNLDKLEKEFIPIMLENKQASTVKNYLLSFKRFVVWANLKNKRWFFRETADIIFNQINLWNQSLHKMITHRRNVNKLEHRKSAITVKQVCMYLKGDRAKAGQDVFARYTSSCLREEEGDDDDNNNNNNNNNNDNNSAGSGGCSHVDGVRTDMEDNENNVLTQAEHTLARNYLIMLMVLSNASRAGPIINLKVGEVEAARDNVHEELHVINVLLHKTQKTYGAAQISLRREDFTNLWTYVTKIRPEVVKSKAVDDVFVTWSGRPLNQSEVANIITSELMVATGRDKRSSCTVMRKSIVSILLQLDLGARTEKDLASLMKHSQGMQRRTYDLRVADKNMARMSNLVFKVMSGQEITKEDVSTTKDVCDDEDVVSEPMDREVTPNTPTATTTTTTITTTTHTKQNNLLANMPESISSPTSPSPSSPVVSSPSPHAIPLPWHEPPVAENCDTTSSSQLPCILSPVQETVKSVTTTVEAKELSIPVPLVVPSSSSLSSSNEALSSSPSPSTSTQKVQVNTKPSRNRYGWPKMLRAKVEKAFSDEIDRRSIKSERVKEVLDSNPELLQEIREWSKTKKYTVHVKKTFDLIRSFWRYKK